MASDRHPFFPALLSSLQPSGYRKLRDAKPMRAFTYVFLLVLFALLVKAILAVPLALDIHQSLQNVSSKFESGNFQAVLETREPIFIPKEDPLIQIDTSQGAKKGGFVLVTDKGILYGDDDNPTSLPFLDFSRPVATDELMPWILLAAILVLPSIIILFFLAGLLKAVLFALLMSAIAFALRSYRKSRKPFSMVLALALYSTTAMVLLEAVMMPLRMGSYLFPAFSFMGMTIYLVSFGATLCVFLIWFVILGSEKYSFED